MYKRRKRCISVLILMSILCLMYSNAVKADDIISNENKKKYLISKGFPEDILSHSNSQTIEHVYDQAIQNGTEVFSYQNDECIVELGETSGSNKERTAIPASKLRLVATTVNYADSSGKITACDVDITYDWLVTPGTTSTDVITLGWDQSLFAYSGYLEGYNYVKNIGNSGTDIYNIIHSASLGNAGMIGWYAELRSPNISPKLQSGPGGWAYASFIPARPFYSSDGISSNFIVQYNHNKSGTSIELPFRGVGISADCGVGVDSVAKTAEYEYPISPDKEEWGQYNHGEKVDMLNIDQEILDNLQTDELLEVVLEYPLFSDMYFHGGYQTGFEIMSEHFNGLQELMGREDAADCLIKKHQEMEEPQNIEEQVTLANLEIILAQPCVRQLLSEADEKYMEEQQKMQKKRNVVSSNFFTNVYEKCVGEQKL